MLSQGLRYPVFVRHYSSYSYHNFRLYLIGCSSNSIYHCFPFFNSSQLYLTSYRASWHLLCGSPSPLFCTPYSVVGLVDKVGFEPTTWRFPHSLCSFHHSIRVGLQLSQLSLLTHIPGCLDPTLVRMELNTAPFCSMPLANDDIRFVSGCSTPAFHYLSFKGFRDGV